MRPGLNSAIFQNPCYPFALQTVRNLAKETKSADVKQDSQNCHGTDTVGVAPLPAIPECSTEGPAAGPSLGHSGTLCEDAAGS